MGGFPDGSAAGAGAVLEHIDEEGMPGGTEGSAELRGNVQIAHYPLNAANIGGPDRGPNKIR
jgi:hypothetical protein